MPFVWKLGRAAAAYPRHAQPRQRRSSHSVKAVGVTRHAHRNQFRIKVQLILSIDGPRVQPHDGRVVYNVIAQAVSGQPVTRDGDGLHTRSQCGVDDPDHGALQLMYWPEVLTSPVNVGNSAATTICTLAEAVLRMIGLRSPLVMRPLPPDDVMQCCADIKRVRAQLGREPLAQPERGLARTFGYVDRLLSRPLARALGEVAA
jgi:UDP-glucuronate decarboxylase